MMAYVSQTHVKMEELAKMERVRAQLATRERCVKHAVNIQNLECIHGLRDVFEKMAALYMTFYQLRSISNIE